MTFALSVTWSTPVRAIFTVNSIGVIIQMAAMVMFAVLVRNKARELKLVFTGLSRSVMLIAVIALILKILVQTAVAVPAIAEISYTIRNFVVGFIHLLMLGCLSLFLLVMISIITGRRMSKYGVGLFVAGVVVSELLLFTQGVFFWLGAGFLPGYYSVLAIASGLILIGVLMYIVKFVTSKE
jgi:hypothetical protein